jgi:hypothetical protein
VRVPDYRGLNQIGNPVFNSEKREIGMVKKILKNRILKRIIIFAVIFDILMLLFEYRIIQFGAFCLGLKTFEIVYERTVQGGKK